MNIECWLKVRAVRSRYTQDKRNPDFYTPTDLKVLKSKPSTRSDEIAVKINLSIPNALFEKPVIEFRVKIPESAATLPTLEADITDDLAVRLEEQLGQRVHLTISSEPDSSGEDA